MLRRSLLAAAALTMAGAAFAQAKWDLPAAYPATNFHTENLQQFAADVDKLSGGKLRITVHANASLFKANEIKRAVQGGQAQAGEILMANFANEAPVYALDGIPFLASSYGEAKILYDVQRPALDKVLAGQGMKLLYSVPWPPQGIYTKKRINSVADMRGIKWRAYSPATAKIAELIGAQPVTIQAAELTQALATGTVESYMSSGSTGYDSKTYEHIKNWYDTQAWLPKNAVIVNKRAFDALDKPTQDAVVKAAADAETRGWKLSEEKNEWYKKALAEKGMTIHRPHAKLKADLEQVGGIMLADWEKTAGPEGQALVAEFKARRAKAPKQ
jgi:TRAP-type C4-dicarboxylate transport system substrate-binding protein